MDYQTQLDWLVTMAQHPGWKDHAWHRAKQLEADPCGIWAGLKQELVGLVGQSESEGQNSGKPRLVKAKSSM